MFGFGKKEPNTREVVVRTYALRAVFVHLLPVPPPDMMTQWKQEWTAQDWEKFCRDTDRAKANHLAELKGIEYDKYVTPSERKTITKRVSELTMQEHLNIQWRIESVEVLLWALQRLPALPPMARKQQASADILKEPIVAPFDVAVSTWTLRDRSELEAARGLAELWHWRSRTRELIESGATLDQKTIETTGFQNFDDIVRHTARAAAEAGDLEMVDGDFSIGGKAYRDLSLEEWGNTTSISMERHFALNWLCGHAPKNRWDDTPTDT